MTNEERIAAASELIDKHLHATPEEKGKLIDAIEAQIKVADPYGVSQLLAYLKEVQLAGRNATMALVKLVKEKNNSTPDKTDKAILDLWSNAPEAAIENVLTKFAANLAPADQKIVDDSLSEMTERERSFVTLGAIVGRDIDGGLFLAVNLYRSLFAGVTREKLLSALKVCQIYCGLPAYVAASRTLVILEEVLAGMPRTATPAEVIEKLVKRFDTSN